LKLGYVILYVPDVRAAVDFYITAFALKLRFIHESGQYAEMETGSTTLAFANERFTPTCGMFVPNRREKQSAGAEIALIAKNVEESYEQAVRYGALVVLLPVRKPWGQVIAYVKDLNGFLVEICSEMK
jgi:lactoylglutathione lyase